MKVAIKYLPTYDQGNSFKWFAITRAKSDTAVNSIQEKYRQSIKRSLNKLPLSINIYFANTSKLYLLNVLHDSCFLYIYESFWRSKHVEKAKRDNFEVTLNILRAVLPSTTRKM